MSKRAEPPPVELRDHFAGLAMAHIVGSFDVSRHLCENDPRYNDTNFREVAALNAYEFADAMLEVRQASRKKVTK